MRLVVNGAEREFGEGLSVARLIELEGVEAGRGVAVAVDAEVVPRSAWQDTKLSEGQQVELLEAIQGG